MGSYANQETADEFSRRVEHLWPDDYNWMLRAAVVRDAVTAFEVYLEIWRRALMKYLPAGLGSR